MDSKRLLPSRGVQSNLILCPCLAFIGVFSYVGVAIQERISGHLIQQGTTIVNGVRHYDFHHVVLFWMGMAVVSMILAASLWRAKVSD